MPRHTLQILCACMMACLFGLVQSTPARAVVITAATDVANVRAPARDPGWLNIGKFGGGSAIYLGNRWMLTAGHVTGRDFIMSDGRTIPTTLGSDTLVFKSGQPGIPDLRMYQLSQDPGLPTLTIASQAPTVGTQVMMIGAGTDRAARLSGWDLTQVGLGYQWTETSPLQSDVVGYQLLDTRTMRWGLNLVSKASTFRSTDTTQVFTTTYDRNGITFEGQATTGDSGGAVFVDGGEAGSLLAGMMVSSQPLNGQPANAVTYQSQTAIADLSFYRDEILSIATRLDAPWQSRTNYFDVDGNGGVQTADALTLINKLHANGFLDLSSAHLDDQPWFDVNGDMRGNSKDLLAVFNEIRRLHNLPPASPSADPLAALSVVPEPASSALAALGAAALLAARWVVRRRQR